MRARGRRFSYDATLGVQMQVHLHRADKFATGTPRKGARGNAQVPVDGGGKDTRVGRRAAAERDERWI